MPNKPLTLTLTITETYYPDSTQIRSRDCRNAQGRHHNPAGPAVEFWHSDGQPAYQAFCINGERHNPAGPAVEFWYSDGRLQYQEFYINGEKLTEAEWKAKTQTKPVPVVLIDGVRYVPEN